MKATLISGHGRDWHAGASTVYLHLAQELKRAGIDVSLHHLEDYADGRSGTFLKATAAFRIAKHFESAARSLDVVEVAGNYGWKIFSKLRTVQGRGPLLVNRLHGLEFKDEQARIDEEIAGQIRLGSKYKLIGRRITNWQERRSIAAADLVICHSSRDIDAIIAAKWKAEAQVALMPLGVDERFLAGGRESKHCGNRLLWWGSWVERKGISTTPRAFELALRQRPDLTLTLGGLGNISADAVLTAFAPQARLQVKVLPFLSPQEHLSTLLDHDIFVFPSLSEGFGLALLEAMATGMAVVTTFTGMAHDWLEHDVNCLLTPMSAPTSLSRAIVGLAGSGALREKIGSGARQTARQMTWERLGRATIETYTEHLERKRAAQGKKIVK